MQKIERSETHQEPKTLKTYVSTGLSKEYILVALKLYYKINNLIHATKTKQLKTCRDTK